VNVALPGSNDSHFGNGEPSAARAEYTSESPASGSTKVAAGSWKRTATSLPVLWFGSGAASVGASLTLAVVSTKSAKADTLEASVAVTRIVSAPTSALPGVPLKVCVAASKLSHAGSALPLLSVAV
jgi:hypothetical protein